MRTIRLSIPEYTKGILAGDRVILAKAITLIESELPKDKTMALLLMDQLLPFTGNSLRIGITGSPGVGKSTFIEAFGGQLTREGKKIAVLTIDPSSQATKGSILGDKTRMEELSKDPMAFIRPTASSSVLGGVAGKTREAMLLCEAAGYEIIIVETVGVGQSEITVKNMVDFFLLLMLAGAGDELQGIKKGIMEMADAVVVTKADDDNLKHATEAQAAYQHALHLRPDNPVWRPTVLTCSAVNKTGIAEIWKTILSFREKTSAAGVFQSTRYNQNISWFYELLQQLLSRDYLQFEDVKQSMNEVSENVGSKKITPHQGAQQLLDAYHEAIRGSRS